VDVVRLVGGIHPDIEGFRLLYERQRRDNADAAPFEEIAGWLTRCERFGGIATGWTGYLLAAKLGWEVVGFLHFDLHIESGNLFLRDFSADESNKIAAQFARPALFREATCILRSENRRVKRILFETEANADTISSSVKRLYAAWWGTELAGCPTTVRTIPLDDPHPVSNGSDRTCFAKSATLEAVPVAAPNEPIAAEEMRMIHRIAHDWNSASRSALRDRPSGEASDPPE
jgi:hypothetical protein